MGPETTNGGTKVAMRPESHIPKGGIGMMVSALKEDPRFEGNVWLHEDTFTMKR